MRAGVDTVGFFPLPGKVPQHGVDVDEAAELVGQPHPGQRLLEGDPEPLLAVFG